MRYKHELIKLIALWGSNRTSREHRDSQVETTQVTSQLYFLQQKIEVMARG